MYFIGKPIAIDDIQAIVAQMTVDAEDMLWEELMFKEGEDVHFTVLLSKVEDDLTYSNSLKLNTRLKAQYLYTNLTQLLPIYSRQSPKRDPKRVTV
jgi:hypothetical protein